MRREFTGRHMTAILVAGFGVVVAVNVAMARFATESFGGIVVENSYVASQNFNEWLDAAREQESLGWDATLTRQSDDHIALTLSGVDAAARVDATARHPLGRLPDTQIRFVPAGEGRWISAEPIAPGRWTVRLHVESQGREWRRESAI